MQNQKDAEAGEFDSPPRITRRELANRLGWSKDQVARAIGPLEADGYVDLRQSGRGHTYRVADGVELDEAEALDLLTKEELKERCIGEAEKNGRLRHWLAPEDLVPDGLERQEGAAPPARDPVVKNGGAHQDSAGKDGGGRDPMDLSIEAQDRRRILVPEVEAARQGRVQARSPPRYAFFRAPSGRLCQTYPGCSRQVRWSK